MDNDNWNGQVRVNKDILKYSESVFMGLNAKQLISSVLTIVITLGVYFFTHKALGNGGAIIVGSVCAFPVAAFGFVTYNGMSFAQLIKAVAAHIQTPEVLHFRSKSFYSEAIKLNRIIEKDERKNNAKKFKGSKKTRKK